MLSQLRVQADLEAWRVNCPRLDQEFERAYAQWPGVQQGNVDAHGQARRQRRWCVLGLFRLPGLPRHTARQLNLGLE